MSINQSETGKSIQTIVVPIDGSSVGYRVLPVVRSLAETTGAETLLVTSNQNVAGASTAGLELATAAMSGHRVRYQRFDDRDAARTAIDATGAGPDRVLVMSTHGRGGLKRALLGSVAGEVIRSGEVPLILIGPGCDPEGSLDRPGPIVLCIDGSARSGPLVAEGLRWARLLERDVQMVMVANPLDAATPGEIESIAASIAAPLESAGLDPSIDCVFNTSVPGGLVDEARTRKAPLMVLAARPRSTRETRRAGSTTMAVLGHAPCPVLVMPGAE